MLWPPARRWLNFQWSLLLPPDKETPLESFKKKRKKSASLKSWSFSPGGGWRRSGFPFSAALITEVKAAGWLSGSGVFSVESHRREQQGLRLWAQTLGGPLLAGKPRYPEPVEGNGEVRRLESIFIEHRHPHTDTKTVLTKKIIYVSFSNRGRSCSGRPPLSPFRLIWKENKRVYLQRSGCWCHRRGCLPSLWTVWTAKNHSESP